MLKASDAGSRSVLAVKFTDTQLKQIHDATTADIPVFQHVYPVYTADADRPALAAQYAAWYCRHQYAKKYGVNVKTLGSKTRKNGDGYSFVIFAKAL